MKLGSEKVLLPLEDGDKLVLHVYDVPHPRAVLVMVHGLGGSVQSDYMRRASYWANELGLALVLVNMRGAGEGLSHARGVYHSGSAGDVSRVLEWARDRWPGRKRIAAGFSLSGNILLNLLGGQSPPAKERPDAAIAVNPAIDLVTGSRMLSSGLNLIYDQKFVSELKRALHDRVREGLLDRVPEFPLFCKLSDFDEIFTAKAAGFANRQEYYEKCSSGSFVHNVSVPTSVLMADDDPFIPVGSFRFASWSEDVEIRYEKTGGHVGYIHDRATPLGNRRWMDYYLVRNIQRMLKLVGG